MSTLTDLFTSVAAAIRSKTGGAGTIVASNFPSAISSIVTLAGGSADATAAAGDILTGKTAYSQGVKVTGNIPIQGTQVATPYNTDVYGNFGITIPASGFYGAGSILYAHSSAAGLTPEKILQGQSILGVAGNALKYDPVYGSIVNTAKSRGAFYIPDAIGKDNVIVCMTSSIQIFGFVTPNLNIGYYVNEVQTLTWDKTSGYLTSHSQTNLIGQTFTFFAW